jgi:flagellar biosynthesis protein FlhG
MTTQDDLLHLHSKRRRFIAVTGGKGGTGKSTIAVNLAATYARQGSRVLLVDADLGMADLNLLLGVAPNRSIFDLLHGKSFESVLAKTHGVYLLPSLNGSYQLANLDASVRDRFLSLIEKACIEFDTVIIDTAAGLGANSIDFAAMASEVILVTSSAPASLADTYACLKVLSSYKGLERAYILPNGVSSLEEAKIVFSQLASLSDRFLLSLSLHSLPAILFDNEMNTAAANGIPMVCYKPEANVSRALRLVAHRLDLLATANPKKLRGYLTQTGELAQEVQVP